MKLKNVSHYAIYDQKFDNWKSEVLDRWTYDDFVRDPQYKKKWISITSLAYHLLLFKKNEKSFQKE